MKRDESKIQIAIMDYLNRALPANYRAIHVPNGGRRDAITGARLKREGVKAGFPDIQIIRNDDGYSAFIEVKTAKGALSPAQKEWRDWFERGQAAYAVVRDIEDVEAFLIDQNIPLKTRLAA